MNKLSQLSHTERMREEHKRNLRIIKHQLPMVQGLELRLMQAAEEYHISRLHSLWFSTSRREKQC
jgi:hypothetical protein